MTTLTNISPEKARQLIAAGAVLVDVREADEHARERIAGAAHAPLSAIAQNGWRAEAAAVIFHCKSGMRTQANADLLCGCADGEAYLLAGGLDAWRAAGLPTAKDSRQPLEMQRQVMIATGGLILLMAVLALAIDPLFWWGAAAIGAGLLQAGLTGWCGMAKLLAIAPWNRVSGPLRA